MTLEILLKLLRPLKVLISNMVSRGVVSRVDDAKKMQLVQVGLLADETRDDVERVQNYGFTSVPLEGAETVVLFVGGRRDHGLAVAVDDRRYRLTGLADGEVAVYDQTGSKIVLKANGDVEIVPSSGFVIVTGDVQADGVSLKAHTHAAGTLTNSGGSVTGTTGGPV